MPHVAALMLHVVASLQYSIVSKQ